MYTGRDRDTFAGHVVDYLSEDTNGVKVGCESIFLERY